jgi:hypothetical protein
MKNMAFESTVVSWLMHDGWQVFLPILDHGHKTDILISDGPHYHCGRPIKEPEDPDF